ncbi:hypothetical protein [Ralstonia sp. UBA689]|uniref:hypothetical protein n=1 Tax=Ralstonia sp. UBA689 TaxID=1947373 RepID=UPI0025E93F19|nr:hypothetical protein [Ralstonia sp. UBA689]
MRNPFHSTSYRCAATHALAVACLLLTACQSGVQMPTSKTYYRQPIAWPRMQTQAQQGDPAQAPAAVLLGVQWLNPLMRRSYPTQWNLLWAQGLAQTNDDDLQAKRFKLGDAVGQLTLGLSRRERLEDFPHVKRDRFESALSKLITAPLLTFNDYLEDANYFYSLKRGTSRPNYLDPNVFFGLPREWLNTPTYLDDTHPSTGQKSLLKEQEAMGMPAPSILAYDAAHAEERMRDYWVTLHKDDKGKTVRGLRVFREMIIGERTLSLLAVRRLVFHEIASDAQAKSMLLNPEGKLPNVTVSAGDTNVGFYNLQDALKFLAQHPNKLAWVWNVDAPNYPMGEQTNENTALLILGHPSADWGYTALASICTPHRHRGAIGNKAANSGGAWTGLMQAVQAQASEQHPVERVYYDVPKHAANINTLMGPLRAAIHQQWPDLDQIANVYSVAEHMEGPARAASFAVNAAFAAAYANQSGKSAVVTSVADATDSWAVLIGPPPGWQPKPPVTYWPRARGENRAYWAWFGERTGGNKADVP